MENPVQLAALLAQLRRADNAAFAMVCALVIGLFAWSAESGFQELGTLRAEDSYYNLLVQGFRAGQLNVNRDAPPGLSQLSDPYDPASNVAYVWDKNQLAYEMSYYKGKLYLYFGVTPAVVLFWPYVLLTGHYLLHKDAVVIFFGLGFLVAAGLVRACWRRYFPETGIWVVMAGILAMGLTAGILETLSSCDVYEVAKSCGFAFTMLSLASIWRALREPKRQVVWLLLASLTYGLAIGSRPSLLFGAIILLVPVTYSWRAAAEPSSRRRLALLLAAAGPLALVGLGLMLYNALRFDNPFEFGWHYQLTSFKQNTAHQFSLHYLWFNFRFYFLAPLYWGGQFPFLHAAPPPPSPSGFWGVGDPYGGILVNNPVVWLALAAPLAWRGRPFDEAAALRWFAAAVFLLFAICALTMCLFFAAGSRYEVDFLPTLMLLAMIGVLGLERVLAGLPGWRRIARWGWCLLLAYSVLFNILVSVKSHAGANYIAGNSLLNGGRLDEAVEHYRAALALEPDSATYLNGLGAADCRMGLVDDGMALFQKALEIEPRSAEAHFDLGCNLLQQGRVNEAAVHFQKALEIDPNIANLCKPEENNNMAWSLATNPDASKRNGVLAVKLAEASCQRTQQKETVMVGTLAAAYAEAGWYDKAIGTAQKACELAAKKGETNLVAKNEELLKLYQRHQPYRDRQTNPPEQE